MLFLCIDCGTKTEYDMIYTLEKLKGSWERQSVHYKLQVQQPV